MQIIILLVSIVRESGNYEKQLRIDDIDSRMPYLVMSNWRDEGKPLPLLYAACNHSELRSFAVSRLLTFAPTPFIVLWCELHPVGSHCWKDAIWSLRYHENPMAFHYLVQVANRKDPVAKWFAYEVGRATRWSCLRRSAIRDLKDMRRVGGPGTIPGYDTVGQSAEDYLEILRE